MSDKIHGFEPFYGPNSEVLVLGSFPSVKSRKVDFYYGNRQNRFWKMLYGYFGVELREDIPSKKDFLIRRGIALWDVVAECEIDGSADASIRNYRVADISALLSVVPVRLILLNGALTHKLFCEHFRGIELPFLRMPSTSPANPRFDAAIWYAALDTVFAYGKK